MLVLPVSVAGQRLQVSALPQRQHVTPGTAAWLCYLHWQPVCHPCPSAINRCTRLLVTLSHPQVDDGLRIH